MFRHLLKGIVEVYTLKKTHLDPRIHLQESPNIPQILFMKLVYTKGLLLPVFRFLPRLLIAGCRRGGGLVPKVSGCGGIPGGQCGMLCNCCFDQLLGILCCIWGSHIPPREMAPGPRVVEGNAHRWMESLWRRQREGARRILLELPTCTLHHPSAYWRTSIRSWMTHKTLCSYPCKVS